MMVASEPSAYFNAVEKEEEWLIDVRKNDNHPLMYKDVHDFGILLIESLSESNMTLYSDYMLVIKDTIKVFKIQILLCIITNFYYL